MRSKNTARSRQRALSGGDAVLDQQGGEHAVVAGGVESIQGVDPAPHARQTVEAEHRRGAARGIRHVERAVPETAHVEIAHPLEHEGGQEADHPEVPVSVGEVEADIAVRHRVGDGAEDFVLLVGVLAGWDETRRDGKTDGLTHERGDVVEHWLLDLGVRLRVEQRGPLRLRLVSLHEVLDEHAPLTAARAENDGGVGFQMPGQRHAEERRLPRSVLVGELVTRPLVSGLRILSGSAQEGDQCVAHDAPAPDSSSGDAVNSPSPKWLP